MPLHCMQKVRCAYPDCSCTEATKKGRWLGKEPVEAPTPRSVEMYAGSDRQKADPDTLRALVEREYGLTPAKPPALQQAIGRGYRTIPIAMQPPAEQLFDADVLRIMFQECGATIYEGGHENTIYIPQDFFTKLATALNNLPS